MITDKQLKYSERYGSNKTFKRATKITEDDVKGIYKKFFKSYKNLSLWHSNIKKGKK